MEEKLFSDHNWQEIHKCHRYWLECCQVNMAFYSIEWSFCCYELNFYGVMEKVAYHCIKIFLKISIHYRKSFLVSQQNSKNLWWKYVANQARQRFQNLRNKFWKVIQKLRRLKGCHSYYKIECRKWCSKSQQRKPRTITSDENQIWGNFYVLFVYRYSEEGRIINFSDDPM